MSQYNNIKITPNIGVTSDPIIEFTGAANSTITLKVLDTTDAGLTFVGEKAEILSIIDSDPSPTSQIPRFSVNDYYGLPQIQAYNDGRVVLTFVDAQNVGIGTVNPTEKLDVVGNIKLSGAIYGPSTLIIDPAAVGDDTGTVAIAGSLGINEPNPQSALSVNGYIQESTDGGTVYYNVVTQQDVGTAPNQVPLNQFLGEMAYANYPFAQVLDNISGSDSIVSINASAVDLYSHIASLTTNVTYQISNLTTGNEIKMYIRNTDASARTITIQASETTSGHTNVNLAPGSSPPGGSSVNSITLNATDGTTLIWVSNISGNIVGGILA